MRLPYFKLSAKPFNGLIAVKKALDESSLDQKLIELIYVRVSQINGCDYCVKVHSQDLKAQGDTQQRIDQLGDYRNSDQFSEREKKALGWAESVTKVIETKASDEYYLPLKDVFSDQEISDLTVAISLINAFNRIAIALGH